MRIQSVSDYAYDEVDIDLALRECPQAHTFAAEANVSKGPLIMMSAKVSWDSFMCCKSEGVSTVRAK